MFLAEAVVSHEAVTVRVKYCNEMVIIFSTTSPRAIGRRAATKDIVSLVITGNFLFHNVSRRQFSLLEMWRRRKLSCENSECYSRRWSNTNLATGTREVAERREGIISGRSHC